MDVYGLTNKGLLMARNIRSPDEPRWRVIHFLYRTPRATIDQIADSCGISRMEAARVIRQLDGIVAKE